MDRLLKVWGYLRKHSGRGIRINGDDPVGLPEFDEAVRGHLRSHYPDAREDTSPDHPEPLGKPLKVSVFCDSDWASNESDRRSRTGVLIFAGNTPVSAKSVKQTGVQTSSYGAELSALRTATEAIIGMRAVCRSFGIPVEGASPVYGDNLGVLVSVSNATTTLRRKHNSISWHYVREAVAAGIISPIKVWSAQNPSDLMTKAVSRSTFHPLVNSFMTK